MRRREFIAGLGSAAGWPLVARAQQRAVPVVGFLSAQSAEVDYKDTTVPFLQGLKESGYVEGRNVAVEYRYAENQLDRLPVLAADLARRRVAVIVASAITVARAAKAATTTAPTRCCEKVAKAGSRSRSVLAFTTTSCRPSAGAAACRSAMADCVFTEAGSARTPNRAASGINSRSNCSRTGR